MHYQRSLKGADMDCPPKSQTPQKLLWIPVMEKALTLSVIDMAYLAGFFDGEGSVAVYTNGKRNGFTLRVQITQNKTRESTILLNKILDEFGGSLGDNSKSAWNYQCSGGMALHFLETLLPHLRLKKEQAQLAVDWYKNREENYVIRRDVRGRIVKRPNNLIQLDWDALNRLKELKREGSSTNN